MSAEGYSCKAIDNDNILYDISSISIVDDNLTLYNINYAVMLRPIYDSLTGKKSYIRRIIYR